MKKKNFEQLVSIYEALLTISTKGQDTILMAKCLNTFQLTLQNLTTEPFIETETEKIEIPISVQEE